MKQAKTEWDAIFGEKDTGQTEDTGSRKQERIHVLDLRIAPFFLVGAILHP